MDGTVAAVVLAAGHSRRFGADKLLTPLRGRPLLRYTLAAFEASAAVNEVILVVAPERVAAFRARVRHWRLGKLRAVCPGGERRRDSVYDGLAATGAAWVIVHDGARPFVTPALIERCLTAAEVTGAAVCGVPVVDTLKAVSGTGLIQRTVPREGTWAVQTPQVFRRDLLCAAHQQITEDVTDDAALLERLGHPVRMVEGESWNLKVTHPCDLELAAAVLRQRAAGSGHLRQATRRPTS